MNQETIEKYRQAGKIAAQVLDYGKNLIKKNASLLEVTEKIEARILELGAKPAFPAQVSLNEIAAHYCSTPDDKTVFMENDIAKLSELKDKIAVEFQGIVQELIKD